MSEPQAEWTMVFAGDRGEMSRACHTEPDKLKIAAGPILEAVQNGLWSDDDRDMADWLVHIRCTNTIEIVAAMRILLPCSRLWEMRCWIKAEHGQAVAMVEDTRNYAELTVDTKHLFGTSLMLLENCHASLGAVIAGRYDRMEAE